MFITIEFTEKTAINEIHLYMKEAYTISDKSKIKLFIDDNTTETTYEVTDCNAYSNRRYQKFTFTTVEAKKVTIRYADSSEKNNVQLLEVEGYNVPDSKAEVKFEVNYTKTDDTSYADKKMHYKLVDVAIITSISEAEAQSFASLKYDVVVLNFPGKEITNDEGNKEIKG